MLLLFIYYIMSFRQLNKRLLRIKYEDFDTEQIIHDVKIVSHITRNRLFCSRDKQWLLPRRKSPVFQCWHHRPRTRTCHDCILMPGISCRCTHRLWVYICLWLTRHSKLWPWDVHKPFRMMLLQLVNSKISVSRKVPNPIDK